MCKSSSINVTWFINYIGSGGLRQDKSLYPLHVDVGTCVPCALVIKCLACKAMILLCCRSYQGKVSASTFICVVGYCVM